MEYTTEDVLKAEVTLEPMVCKYCGSNEVVFLQYIGDSSCQSCGKWQTEDNNEIDN